MSYKMFLPIIVVLLALTAGNASGNRQPSVTLSVDQTGIVEGDTITFTVVGDDAGWVKTICVQSGHEWNFPGSWYYPFYGYFGASIIQIPSIVNTGELLSCTAYYYDFLGYKSSRCGSFYPPIMSDCTKTKLLAQTKFVVLSSESA